MLIFNFLKLLWQIPFAGSRRDICREDPYVGEIYADVKDEIELGIDQPRTRFQECDVPVLMNTLETARDMLSDEAASETTWSHAIWYPALSRADVPRSTSWKL
jgi:hypothetical protein